MHAHHVSGVITVAAKSDHLKASVNAGSTVLTGLTGQAGAHTQETESASSIEQCIKNLHVCAIKAMLTLLTTIKASIHAGFSVTGFAVQTVMTCKGA